MSISEQVKELKWYASYQECKKAQELMYNAADTIESLCAKLADIERSKELNKKMLRYGFCPDCGAPVGRDASSCFECGAVLDWDLIKDMERTAEDCGGWIYCGDGENLPEPGRRYRVTALWKDGDFEMRSVYDLVYGTDGLWHGENYIPVSFEIIAWKPLEEPYRENIEEHVRKSILGVAQMSDKAWAAYRKEQRTLRRSKRR